ncbi:MAG: PAS-domain containing protein [Acetobacteraceae bacterium]
MSSRPRRHRHRRVGSTARRYKPSELVPIDPRRQISREAILVAIAVGLVAAALIALIWILANRSIDESRTMIREQVEQSLAAQAATLSEEVRLELNVIDQTLAVLQAAWTKDPEGFKLSDWHKSLPALTSVADDIFIADQNRIIQQDILPQAVGQGIGAAYLNFPHGSLELFDPDGGKSRETRIIPSPTNASIEARRFLVYIARPLGDPPKYILGASYRSGELTRHYAEAALGFNGVAAMIDTRRGGLQAIAGPSARRPRTDVSHTEMFEAIKKGERGVWTGPTGMDGAERIHGYHIVPGRDLVVLVGMLRSQAMAPAEALASATRSVAVVASGLVVIIAGVVIWALARRRERRRQARTFQRAQTDLQTAQSDLAAARSRGTVAAAQVRALLDGTTDAAATFDADLKLSNWNERFALTSGIEATALREGLPLDEVLRLQARAGMFGGGEDPEAEVARRMQVLLGGATEAPLTQMGPAGTPIVVSAQRMPDSGLVLFLGGLSEWQAPPRVAPEPDLRFIEPVAEAQQDTPSTPAPKVDW